jgi:hypothetical protein
MKAKTVNKLFSWKEFWIGRCAVAVLNRKDGGQWKAAQYDSLGLPALSDGCRTGIDRYSVATIIRFIRSINSTVSANSIVSVVLRSSW